MNKIKYCKYHPEVELRPVKYGSSIMACPKCEGLKRIKKNNELMKKATHKTKTSSSSKKVKSKKGIDKKLDEAWSKLVKLNAGHKCECCGKTKYLNSHHLFSRGNHSVRWKLINGMCLCVGCHIGPKFSAHKTPIDFTLWLIEKKGNEYVDKLRVMANKTVHYSEFEREIMLSELNKEINKYE